MWYERRRRQRPQQSRLSRRRPDARALRPRLPCERQKYTGPAIQRRQRAPSAATVEFVPVDEVCTTVKCIGRGWRGAARHALTRGRWRPLKLVSEIEPTTIIGRDATSQLTTFRAAWEIEPGLALRELADWYEELPYYKDDHFASFLSRVEPTIDGLTRIVAASEGTWLSTRRHSLLFLEGGPANPWWIMDNWSRFVGCRMSNWRFGPERDPEEHDITSLLGPGSSPLQIPRSRRISSKTLNTTSAITLAPTSIDSSRPTGETAARRRPSSRKALGKR